jgi:hypothetical protein
MLRVPVTNGASVDPNRLQSALADAKQVVSAVEPAVKEMLPKVRSLPGFRVVGGWQLAGFSKVWMIQGLFLALRSFKQRSQEEGLRHEKLEVLGAWAAWLVGTSLLLGSLSACYLHWRGTDGENEALKGCLSQALKLLDRKEVSECCRLERTKTLGKGPKSKPLNSSLLLNSLIL